MKSGQLVHEDLEGTAEGVRRAGRGWKFGVRRRKVRRFLLAGIVAVLIGAGVAVALGAYKGEEPVQRPAGVAARPDQSPPRQLIAAGNVAVSAYYTVKAEKRANGDGALAYTWSLLNTTTGRYEETDWARLDVAPGMKIAAVLERGLPVHRIGMVNLATGKVERWIKTEKGVGGVQFSPNGKRLVATTYDINPDGLFKDAPYRLNGKMVPGPKPSRTGFYVIDAASGQADFVARPPRKDDHGLVVGGGRQDLAWTRDGKLLWEPWATKAGRVFYSVDGRQVPVPKSEERLSSPGAVSPDGKLVTGRFVGGSDRIVSEVLDARTGKREALVPGQQLLAWADDDWLIAFRCDPEQCLPAKSEFRNQLILASLDGKHVIPLSGFRTRSLGDTSRWNPVLSIR
ncbi:hypothetical protein ACF1DV_05195 [Streptomyces achromogenes]|uniref:hypothetical protein n=1 Tax=Streptomyces achromogenes TaxID=67255 RepID=UPI0036FB67BA